MGDYYVNEEVRKMYGIPLSKLTPEQRKILREDGIRRKKLIEERQKDVMENNRKAFDDAEKMSRVLSSIYEKCQKEIMADVAETLSKVKKAGGEWSYANQSALTRSRGLFEQINKELIKLGKEEETFFRNNLTNIYTDQFLRATYTLGQTQTVTGNFNMLNPRLVEAALNYPWSGAMFSDRLWLDKDRLGRNLRIGLTQSMILGEDMNQIADRIQANINTSRYNAMRVARTETKRVTYVSQVTAWKEQGIEQVRYMAANGGDSRACELCKSCQGKKYKLGEEPTLPRHPNCRCWYNPVTPDTFKDNELNELTGSVRGAENYEKWKQSQEAKLAEEAKREKKDKTAEDLIRERIEADKKAGQDYRDGITMQINAQMDEYKKVPSQYEDELSEIESKKSRYRGIMSERQAELGDLYAEKETLPIRRRELGRKWDSGEITEDEYDELSEKLRDERKLLTSKISDKESELYSASGEIDLLNEQVKRIQKEIEAKQKEILANVKDLNDKLKESLDSEIDYDLDIAYVGDSMERLKTVDSFRTIRNALRSNSTFDMEEYKDELVQMAQRMDEDALIINSKLSSFASKNWYDNYNGYNGAHYSPSIKRVNMKMSANSHEKALGNGLKGSWQTKFHEEGHQLDHLLANVKEFTGDTNTLSNWAFTKPLTKTGSQIEKSIRDDIVQFLNNAVDYSNNIVGTNYKKVTSLGRIASDTKLAFDTYVCSLTSNGMDKKISCQLGIFTDAIGLFTRDKLSRNMLSCGGWGHNSSYNKDRGESGATSETWATFFALRTCGSVEEVEFTKKIMPNTWKCLNGVYSEIAQYLRNNDLSY